MVNNGNNQKIVRNTRGGWPRAKDDALEAKNRAADIFAKYGAGEVIEKEVKVEVPVEVIKEVEKIVEKEVIKDNPEHIEKILKLESENNINIEINKGLNEQIDNLTQQIEGLKAKNAKLTKALTDDEST